MPDENSAQVGATQTSTNQSGNDNDFVLDFGSLEAGDQTNQTESMEMLQSDTMNEENSSDSDNQIGGENGDELFDKVENNGENLNNLNNDNSLSDESSTEGNIDDDLGFSFDDNTNNENTDDPMQNFDETETSEILNDNTKNSIDSDMEMNEEANQQDVGNDIDFQETTGDLENSQDKENNGDFDMNFDMETDNVTENEATDENLEDGPKDSVDNSEIGEFFHGENKNEELESSNALDLPDDVAVSEDVNKENNADSDIDINTTSSNEEDNNEDMFGDSSLFDNSGTEGLNGKEDTVASDKSSEISESQDSESDNKIIPNNFSLDETPIDTTISITEGDSGVDLNVENNKPQDLYQENVNTLSGNNSFDQNKISDSDVVIQPDISNLLGSETIDFSEEAPNADIVEEGDNSLNNDTQQDSISFDNPNLLEDNNTVAEQGISQSNELSEENRVNNEGKVSDEGKVNDESKVNDEDKPNDNHSNDLEGQSEIKPGTNNDVEENISTESNSLEAQANQVNEVSNEKAMQQNENSSETTRPTMQIGSTLSLDEILDSELHSNPQYSDHSTAVPKNVPTHSNKKTIAIVLGMFILTGCVVVMAFPGLIPSNIIERKQGDTVPTEVEQEDTTMTTEEDTTKPTEEYPYEPDYTTEEESVSEGEYVWEEDESSQHGTSTEKSEQLPKVEYFSEDTVDSKDVDSREGEGEYDAKVYTEDPEDPEDSATKVEKVSIETIRDKISSYRDIERKYSKILEDQQNAKAQKFTSYLKYLCDNYETQSEAGEGLDSETFDSFVSESEFAIDKIKAALGDTDEEVFTFGNS